MRVRGNFVLIEQVSVRREKIVIQTVDETDEENFNVSMRIVQIGKSCEDTAKKENIEVGMFPVFGKHVQFLSSRMKKSEGNKLFVWEHVVPYEDIIGIDDENPIYSSEDGSPLEDQKLLG